MYHGLMCRAGAGPLEWHDGNADLDVRAVGPERWDDLCDLFGPNGTYRGCWCTTWRTSSKEFQANGGEGNRRALESLVRAGEQVGLIGYRQQIPVAWCSVAARSGFQRVLSSTTIAPCDPHDGGMWAVVCFFVRAGHRRQGLMAPMLAAAVDLAGQAGASAVEGYPVDDEGGSRRGAVCTGTIGLYERAGFSLHRRPDGGRRVVMRRDLR